LAVGDPDEVKEVDEVSDPDAPLRVAFSMDGTRPVVDVIGLTSLVGAPARVPHALKPIFDDDRRHRVAPEDHQFRIGTTLPELADVNKALIRKYVERCRRQLAREFEELYGHRPDKPLLIQSRSAKGYRLDPGMVVVPATGDPEARPTNGVGHR
jgi:hypothetical protein